MTLSKEQRTHLYNKTISLIRPGLPTEKPIRAIASVFQNEIELSIEENINFEKDIVSLFGFGKYLSDYDLIILAEIENEFRKAQNLPPCFVREEAAYASFRYYGLQEDGILKRFNSDFDLANFYNQLNLRYMQEQLQEQSYPFVR